LLRKLPKTPGGYFFVPHPIDAVDAQVVSHQRKCIRKKIAFHLKTDHPWTRHTEVLLLW